MSELTKHIRNVQDFPKPGIGFKDITTLIKEKDVFNQSVDALAALFSHKRVDKIVGIESRGFIFGAAMAYKLNIGFVPVRKKGKLPSKTIREEYQLEYGVDSVEIHSDAISAGEKVLIVDDLLATGGTAAAAARLVKKLGGEIQGLVFLIELTFLNGRNKLDGMEVASIIQYDSE
jgi:adenine phosphoribosyltransferase